MYFELVFEVDTYLEKVPAMKQNIYAIASQIPEESGLYRAMQETTRVLLEKNIPIQRPKLGWHITFIPPFEATKDEACWLAAGLEVCHTFFSHVDAKGLMRGKSFGFFSGKKDALVIRMSSNKAIRDLVARFRSQIPKQTNWVYPPESYIANFHATIGEAEHLGQAVLSKGGESKLFGHINIVHPALLESPLLYEKEESGWHPVRM